MKDINSSAPTRSPRSRGIIGGLAAILLTSSVTVLAPVALSVVHAAASADLSNKVVDHSDAGPGDTLLYSIAYSCSGSAQGDNCAGATFADPLPNFTDVYGNSVEPQFVGATFPSQSGPGGHWDGSSVHLVADPSEPVSPTFPTGGHIVVATADADFVAGASGVITIAVKLPMGVIPANSQTLSNTATITLGAATDPSTTATTTIHGTPPSWSISKSGPSTARTNRNVGYTLTACPTVSTSALWPHFQLTDDLPAGAQFVAASNGGVYAGDPVADGTNDRITWNFDEATRPALDGNGCFSVNVTVAYPTVPPAPAGPAETNVGGADKTDTAGGTGSDGHGGTGDLGTAQVITSLLGPQVSFSAGKNTGGNYYVQDGDQVTYHLSEANDSDLPLDDMTLADGPLPAPFTLGSIDSGTWDAGVLGTVQGSTNGSTWTDIPGLVALDGTTNTTVASGLGSYRFVRWVWTGPIPLGFTTGNVALHGTVNGTERPQPYTNCATVSATRGGVDFPGNTPCADFLLETPQPDPGIAKSVSSATAYPGDTLTYHVVAGNSGDATADLVDPIIRDCIPAKLAFQPGSFAGSGWTLASWSTSNPSCTGTAIELHFAGTLAPGVATPDAHYDVVANGFDSSNLGAIIDAGTYTNTATVLQTNGTAFGHCQYGSCSASSNVTVPAIATLNSHKLVKGDRDSSFSTMGQTQPGGTMTWQLNLRNEGNVAATNVQFVDVFPHLGDTGVIRTDQQRLTEYRPYLVTPVTAPAGWMAEYSTSENPCRPEVGGPSSGCDAPNWTTDDSVLRLPTYHSIRLTHVGTDPTDPTSKQIAKGTAFSFQWEMRAPVYDPSYDQGGSDPSFPYEYLVGCTPTTPITDSTHCPSAVNSFAYGVDAVLPNGIPDPGRLTAEPPRVEVRVTRPPTPNALGDRVWYDKNYDGVQDPGETGVPNVYVELYKFDSVLGHWDRYGYTYTDDNGSYLFPTNAAGTDGLPDGTYRVRFYAPDGWDVSPPDTTGAVNDSNQTDPNDATDSDAIGSGPKGPYMPPVGTDAIGGYYETTSVALAGNEIDPSWDMGIWTSEPGVQIDKVTKDSAWPDGQAGDGVSILQGRPVTWIYTVTNSGNARLQNVVVTDDNGTPANPADDPTITNCTIVDDGHNPSGVPSSATAPMALNRGAIMRCTATGTAQRTDYSNNATVTGDPTLDEGTPLAGGPVTDSDPSSYHSIRYDLALAKTVDTTNVLTNDTVVYTIVVKNEGDVPSGAFSVTDHLPDGVSLVGNASPAQTTNSGGVIVWTNLPSLAAGATRTITFTAQVEDYTKKPYRNFAEISADSSALVHTGGVLTPTSDSDSTPDANPANDNTNYGPVGSPDPLADNANITEAGSNAYPNPGDDAHDGEDDADIADFTPVPVYDLALAKVAAVDPITYPAPPVFTIRVYNQGNVPSRAVTVTDQLPTGLAFDAADSDIRCTDNGDTTVTCAISNIAIGSSTDLTIATTVTDWATGPWRNWAEIATDSSAYYATTDADSTPESVEHNGIGKDNTLPGDPYVGVASLGTTYSAPFGSDEDDNDDATVGSKVSIGDYVWLDVNRDGRQGPPATEPPISGATVRLYQADGTTLVASTTTDSNGYYSFANLAPGTQYVVEFVPPAGDGFTKQVVGASTTDSNADPSTGRATVTTPGAGTNFTGPGLADDPTIDAGLVRVDLALTKVLDTSGQHHPGQVLQYTLRPRNNGTTDALTGWKVTEVVPPELTLVSMVGSAGASSIYTCSSNVCTASSALTAGTAAEPIIVTATINANFAGTVHNVAYVSPGLGEVIESNPLGTPPTTVTDTSGTPTNNDAQADLISDIYDLALAKTVGVSGSGVNARITYAITIANQGTLDSQDYTVLDHVPAGLVVDVASISDGGVYDSTARTITWSLSGLAPAATTAVTWQATVGDFTKRPYRNIAEISSDGATTYGPTFHDNDSNPDSDPTNDGNYDSPGVDNASISDAGNFADPEDDADVADVDVPLVYDLALAKTSSTSSMNPSGTVDFTVTVLNQGDVNSQSYSVTDTLPAGMAAVSASNAGDMSVPSRVTWHLSNLAPGATATVTVTVKVTDASKRPFENIAEISSDGASTYDSTNPKEATPHVHDVDSTPDTNTANDNGGGAGDGYGTFEAPANDLGDIADVGTQANGEDDADVAWVDAPVLYDLALVKTGPASFDGSTPATFTIRVLNQGNVPSGNYQVLDHVPNGLTAVSTSDGGVISGTGPSATITWNLSALDPGATRTLTVTMTIADYTTRPWVNVAEISADGAASYDSSGYATPEAGLVHDADSTPDSDPNNDVVVDQTDLPSAQYNDPAVDEDDHDIAPIDVRIVYDLALVKVLPAGQSYKLGSNITFQILVKNQGNVPSGSVSLHDVLPTGLTFVSADHGGTATGQEVRWTLADIAPDEIVTISLVVKMADIHQLSYVNHAEITSDSSGTYSTPTDTVKDKDSTPDTDITNDPLVDTDDVNADSIPNDEDDSDIASISTSEVDSANQALPATGGDLQAMLQLDGLLLAAGAAVMVLARRRRHSS